MNRPKGATRVLAAMALSIALLAVVAASGCVPPQLVRTSSGTSADASTRAVAENGEAAGLRLVGGSVVRVLDGDTIDVRIDGGRVERIRLIGVDAPEDAGEREPFGKKASAYTKSRLLHQSVYLQTDVDVHDRNGHLLAYVWMALPKTSVGGTIKPEQVGRKMFNAWLVGDGYATSAPDEPNVTFTNDFEQLEHQAQQDHRGLWADSSSRVQRGFLVGNSNSRKFHLPDCNWAKQIGNTHRLIFGSRKDALAEGYRPCKTCRP